jgi:pyrroline-5-carboxylate reductase
MVTSPAGTTIAGTNHLDRTAVRGHIIDAVLAAYEKGLAMRR